MIDLSGTTKIRTLGLYQPYANLMLPPANKVETRWVKKGRKAGFPLGVYLIYSCLKTFTAKQFLAIAGPENYERASKILDEEDGILAGYALGIGTLKEVGIARFFDSDYENTFVEPAIDRTGAYQRWTLRFEGMMRIQPFPFKGKQGIGFLNDENRKKIKFL